MAKRKRKAAGRGCFARVAKQCSRFSRDTGRSYRACMGKALKRQCYKTHGRGGKKRCPHGRVKYGPRKGLCRERKVGKRWHTAGRSGARILY
jgi:hypothetical protein